MEEDHNNTKSLDEMREREAELERKIKEDKEVIANENISSSDREAAEERVADNEG